MAAKPTKPSAEAGSSASPERQGDPRLPSGLYFVATPIGAAEDITLRALRILREAEVLLAEDTRRLRQLMDIHGVSVGGRPLIAYHDHNGAAQRPKILDHLAAGARVACASDAGTPLVADPGYALARAAIDAGHAVFAAPGASALLAALSVAGLPTDRFYFGGFLPPKSGARRRRLTEIAALDATLVFYESPHRLDDCLNDMCETLGETRAASLCRELTKRFEEIVRGTLGALAAAPGPRRGEYVIVVGPPPVTEVSDERIDDALAEAPIEMGVREISTMVAESLGVGRRRVYARAVALREASRASEPEA